MYTPRFCRVVWIDVSSSERDVLDAGFELDYVFKDRLKLLLKNQSYASLDFNNVKLVDNGDHVLAYVPERIIDDSGLPF